MNTRVVRMVTMGLAVIALAMVTLAARGPEVLDQVRDLRAIEHERLRALVEADMVVAERLHADDFQLINPIGMPLTRDDYLGSIASGAIDYLLWEPEDIEVRVYGDGAVLRYMARLEIVAFGQRMPMSRFWHTDVYELREGEWQVVWSQATEIR